MKSVILYILPIIITVVTVEANIQWQDLINPSTGDPSRQLVQLEESLNDLKNKKALNEAIKIVNTLRKYSNQKRDKLNYAFVERESGNKAIKVRGIKSIVNIVKNMEKIYNDETEKLNQIETGIKDELKTATEDRKEELAELEAVVIALKVNARQQLVNVVKDTNARLCGNSLYCKKSNLPDLGGMYRSGLGIDKLIELLMKLLGSLNLGGGKNEGITDFEKKLRSKPYKSVIVCLASTEALYLKESMKLVDLNKKSGADITRSIDALNTNMDEFFKLLTDAVDKGYDEEKKLETIRNVLQSSRANNRNFSVKSSQENVQNNDKNEKSNPNPNPAQN